MNLRNDIMGEHIAMSIVLNAMDSIAHSYKETGEGDLEHIGQIIDFLHNYTDDCHYYKEEMVLFPAIIKIEGAWIEDTIHNLVYEHKIARGYIQNMEGILMNSPGASSIEMKMLVSLMIKYVNLEVHHIEVENNIVLPLCAKLNGKDVLRNINEELTQIQEHTVDSRTYLEYYKLLSKLSNDYNYSQKPAV
jgi:hemerythrin-like domain-containing protein